MRAIASKILALAVSVGYCAAEAASIDVEPISSKAVLINISGSIAAGDSDRLKETWESQKNHPSIYLDSRGGDVDEALRMGRFLRAKRAMATVSPGGTCASACVFLLMGAPFRAVTAYSQVIIHRPYTTSTEDLPDEVREKNYRERTARIRSFLDEMHFSQDLFHEMESTPPEQGHLLSEAELTRWGLNATDPVFQESVDAKTARRLGVTMEELVKRHARIESVCNSANDSSAPNISTDLDAYGKWYSKCYSDVEHGIR